MTKRTSARQQTLRHAAELAVAAPQVVAMRLAHMALAGPQPGRRDRAEFHRMGAEKVTAFTQSWQAMGWAVWQMQMAWMTSTARLWWMPWSLVGSGGSGHPAFADPWAVMQAGMAPVHRRAVANARRLAGQGATPRRR